MHLVELIILAVKKQKRVNKKRKVDYQRNVECAVFL